MIYANLKTFCSKFAPLQFDEGRDYEEIKAAVKDCLLLQLQLLRALEPL
jgi:hypothetical protein